jgi:type I restriction enzyme S subunit
MVVRSSILDHTLPIAFVPQPAALNQDMKAVIAGSGILPKYLFHALRGVSSELLRAVRRKGGSVASLDSQKLWRFSIPVPDVGEQERIVSILDKFDALVNDISIGLPAELKARRSQYEYYRGKLLTFKAVERVAV